MSAVTEMDDQQHLVEKVFDSQGADGCWKMLPESSKYYPSCLHYLPMHKATVWTLILLADLCHDRSDTRIKKPLGTILNHLYDPKTKVYSIGKDHFPIPCLNGNILYLESFFAGGPSDKSLKTIEFFHQNQRFDDGAYATEKNKYCSNTSCYGKHTCYWGIVKLLKGLSFVPVEARNAQANELIEKCIDFVLLHKAYLSSHSKGRLIAKNIDLLTFPNMYRSDFLEILWLLKREKVKSEKLEGALALLKSKRLPDGSWNLEKKVDNLVASVGEVGHPNDFITRRAKEVLGFYGP